MKINSIIFMGTPKFALNPLQYLIDNNYKPKLCITQPDRPKGRKMKILSPPVKELAQEAGIRVFQPENINEPESEQMIRNINPDLIITAAYGGYIGRRIRKIPTLAAINIHPSLLPKYRGSTPVSSALFNGDKITGVTIFRLTAKMDAGPVIRQSRYQIEDEDNYTSLLEKLSVRGSKDLVDLLCNWEDEGITEISQKENSATYCYKFDKKDFDINWNDSAERIYDKVRALAEKPAARTRFREKDLKIIKCSRSEGKSFVSPGTIIGKIKNKGLIVAVGNGNLLIEKIQPAGKKIMSAYEFDLGARITSGEKFY